MDGMTLVYQDELLNIWWHDLHAYYLSDWQPVFKKGEELRRAYRACVDAAKARPGAPWLIDASRYSVLDPADSKWIAEWFWPEFAKAGVRFQSVISPNKAVGRMSATRAAQVLQKIGTIEGLPCDSRAQAEAAIIEWREKQRRAK